MSNEVNFNLARVHTNITPGESLKMLRELQGFSQADLEELTGISQSNISNLETGARNMGRERAIILAQALKIHPAVLLFPDYDMQSAA